MNWIWLSAAFSPKTGLAEVAKTEAFPLRRDKQGVIWDALMYVPTVGGLGGLSAMFWYQNNEGLAYLLFFLACFFFYQGMHRVLQRLMVLPSSPVEMDVSRQKVALKLRNGSVVELVKGLRYFSDYADKTFALSGMDIMGRKQQYVFHRGQFSDEASFKRASAALKVYA